ncbi:Hypothetical predicted protein [Olea europaea subsp. europaea]|uniref:Uncharacterized protein n=1 Tax=Olea europaea subsp. europaea TaxID=158383 RepID=A0A8S0UE68_OLEEU|nr:Hypothetical predicted protein [Olea europaea subsp. europaea]
MGMGKDFAYFCFLLLLMLSLLENSWGNADDKGKIVRGKTVYGNSAINAANDFSTGSKGNSADLKDENEFFDAEKRKVYTGPNPLHNR